MSTKRILPGSAAAEKARLSGEIFSKAFYASPNPLAITTLAEGRLIEVNEALLRDVERTREEVIGRTTTELGFYEDPEQRDRFIRTLKKKGRVAAFEVRLRARSGRKIVKFLSAEAFEFAGRKYVLTTIADLAERLRAEEALRESEEKFSKAFHANPNAMCIATIAEGRLIEINKAFVRFSEYSRDEMIGRTTLELGFYEDPEERDRFVRILKKKGRVAAFEVRLRTRSGRTGNGIMSAESIEIAGQRCVLTTITNITERVRVEQALRESEEKFSKAFLGSPNPISISTMVEGRFIEINDALARLLEWPRERMIGRTTTELGVFEDPGQRDRFLRILKKEGKNFASNVCLRTRTGRRVMVILHAVPFNMSGQPCILSALTDITARVRAEEALRRSETQVEALLNAPTDPIILASTDGTVLAANEEGHRWLALPRGRVVGSNIYTKMPPDRAADRRARIAQVVRSGKPIRFEHERDDRILETHIYPVAPDRGRVMEVAIFIRDITGRKRTEETLQKAREKLEIQVIERTAQLRKLTAELMRVENEERQRLSRILHEDLQQMLTGARYRLGALARSAPSERCQRAAREISGILEKSIAVARSLSAELRPPLLAEVGLGAALKWLGQETKQTFGLAVDVQAEPEAEPAEYDRRLFFFHAARELLFNVRKHTKVRTAKVRLRRGRAGTIELEVADRGAGFDPAAARPNGLGLFGIRERAAFFGGQARVTSAPGRGTRVILSLPRP